MNTRNEIFRLTLVSEVYGNLIKVAEAGDSELSTEQLESVRQEYDHNCQQLEELLETPAGQAAFEDVEYAAALQEFKDSL